MANYQAFHSTTRGYSHILKNTCCEDASFSIDEGDIHVAVVSDGHGDPACFRSQIGSRLAVEIAGEKLLSFARNIREQGWEEQLFNEINRERLIRQLIRSIIGNWNLKIAEQLEEQPITEEEFSASRNYEALYRQGEELPHVFGCTLIAILLTDRYMLALQQGDGRCVVVHSDCTADQPVPWDDRCVGNVCTSLCHADAIESCRYYVTDLRKDPVIACFATSDGIEDSLDSQEDVNAFVCNAASILLQEGHEKLLEQLEDYLPRMSESGSADDMSLAGIVNMEADENVAQWLELVYVLSSHRAVLRSATGKVSSMQRKSDYLKEELEQAQARYDQVANDLEENLSLMDRLKQELRRVIRARDNHTVILESAKQKLEKAKADYEDYCEKRQVFAEKVRIAEEDIRKAQEKLDALNDLLPAAQPQEPELEQPDWELSEALSWEEEEQAEKAAEPDGIIPEEEETAVETEVPEDDDSEEENFC